MDNLPVSAGKPRRFYLTYLGSLGWLKFPGPPVRLIRYYLGINYKASLATMISAAAAFSSACSPVSCEW